jgi:superfamily II DNA/RNA helicase
MKTLGTCVSFLSDFVPLPFLPLLVLVVYPVPGTIPQMTTTPPLAWRPITLPSIISSHKRQRTQVKSSSPSSPSHVNHHEAQVPVSVPLLFFDDLLLSENLLRGIYSYGFEKPSPIQQRAIGVIVKGGDVILQAPSGTGKTAALSIGLLQRIDFTIRSQLQGLVLSPTRELALQTCAVIRRIGDFMSSSAGEQMFTQAFVGGSRVLEDVRKLNHGNIVAVGTPGRIADMINCRAFRTESLVIVVLDEADELLCKRLPDQIHKLLTCPPRKLQFVLASTTIRAATLQRASTFMCSPTRIAVPRTSLAPIHQFYVSVEEDSKLPTLVDLCDSASSMSQCVIFVNAARKADWIAEQMRHLSCNCIASVMHAEMASEARDSVMSHFRAGRARVLITTDILSRGIDIQHVSIVINYDLPADNETYAHRIGRCGRFGRKGLSIDFVPASDEELHKLLGDHDGAVVDELPMDFLSHLLV